MRSEGGWSRRGFLTARGLGASAGGVLASLLPEVPKLLAGRDDLQACWSFTRRAMACDWTVYLPPYIPKALLAAEIALDEIQAMDALLTVYADDSAMSLLNRHAGREPVATDERLFELLLRSRELWQATDGAFDVACGKLIKAWGFYQGPRRVPGEAELAAARAASGMGQVHLDLEHRRVGYAVPGLEINLGSVGKGYAIDRAVKLLRERCQVSCALIHGGSSSVYGLGSPMGDDRGWRVGIQNPFQPDRRVAIVRLCDRALGTSSASNQSFTHAGRIYGHVLDPRTGRPADQLGAVSVLAADAATADALATALFVMGLDKAREFCHNHPDIAALLVLKPGHPAGAGEGSSPRPTQGTPARPSVVTCNWPRGTVELYPEQAEHSPLSG